MPEKINLDSLIEKHKSTIEQVPLPLEQMVTNYERKCLAALALEYSKGLSLLEFGTWRGLTTSYLAKVCPHQKIFTINIDTTDKNNINKHQPNELLPHDEIGMECKHLPNVKIVYADSRAAACDYEWTESKHFGFSFVDGAHDYAHVDTDWRTAYHLLDFNGVAAFHNYNPNHTAKKETVDDFVEGGICMVVQETPYLNWKHIENTCIVYFHKPIISGKT